MASHPICTGDKESNRIYTSSIEPILTRLSSILNNEAFLDTPTILDRCHWNFLYCNQHLTKDAPKGLETCIRQHLFFRVWSTRGGLHEYQLMSRFVATIETQRIVSDLLGEPGDFPSLSDEAAPVAKPFDSEAAEAIWTRRLADEGSEDDLEDQQQLLKNVAILARKYVDCFSQFCGTAIQRPTEEEVHDAYQRAGTPNSPQKIDLLGLTLALDMVMMKGVSHDTAGDFFRLTSTFAPEASDHPLFRDFRSSAQAHAEAADAGSIEEGVFQGLHSRSAAAPENGQVDASSGPSVARADDGGLGIRPHRVDGTSGGEGRASKGQVRKPKTRKGRSKTKPAVPSDECAHFLESHPKFAEDPDAMDSPVCPEDDQSEEGEILDNFSDYDPVESGDVDPQMDDDYIRRRGDDFGDEE